MLLCLWFLALVLVANRAVVQVYAFAAPDRARAAYAHGRGSPSWRIKVAAVRSREFGRIFKQRRLGSTCESRCHPDVTGIPGQIRLMEKTQRDDLGSY